MKTKKRFILLMTFFIMTLSVSLHAQDKFEFAVIDYNPSYRLMEISINGTEYKKVKVEKNEIQGDADVNSALKEVTKLVQDGWELFNTNTVAGSTAAFKSYIFYLRKKSK